MEEFFDHFLSSASWSDLNAKESSYWGLCESGELDDSPISTINSNQCLEGLAAQETPTVLINGESDHDHDLLQELLSTRSRKNDQGLADLGHPQRQLEDLADMSRSSLEFPELCPAPTQEEDRMLGFDLQGGYVNNDSEFVRNGYDVLPDEALRFDDLSALVARKVLISYYNDGMIAKKYTEGELDLYNNFRPSVTSAGLNCLSQATPGSISGSPNGTAKPRQRARRGQATDPHSIAERLRREKIAERMRSLQELVPNSNKTDKASMLDEILDYVKFLQLQVKVLSTSRLGTSGEDVPHNKNNQTEVLHPLAGDSPSPDQEALEQETVKLMESSMTMAMAMRYLQSKGLCLIPTTLAASISDAKTSPSSSIVSDGNSCSNKGVKQEVSKELKPKNST